MNRNETNNGKQVEASWDYLGIYPAYLTRYALLSTKGKEFFEGITETLDGWYDNDQALIDQYYADTKTEMEVDRTEYRKRNPEIDATLALWGRIATVKSREAEGLLKSKVALLGIPLKIVPALK